MMFRVNQKVVCISDATSHIQRFYPGANYPRKHGIYTIRQSGSGPRGALLLFCELDNGHFVGQTLHEFYFDQEPGFGAEHFRPVVSRKTSIEIFHRILRSASHKELT